MTSNSNKNCGVYKVTSPTGRIYIGQSVNIRRRISSYKALRCKDQPKLYSSLVKHGFENHQFDVIEYCEAGQLDCSERFWQDEFDAASKHNLNCSLQKCGEKRYVHSEETKKKIGEHHKGEKNFFYGKEGSMKGKKMSEESRKKLSNSMKKRFQNEQGYWTGKKLTEEHVSKSVNTKKKNYVKENNANFGKERSAETKQRISKTRKERGCGKGQRSFCKLVLDTSTGIFFDCAKDAARDYGIKYTYLVDMLNVNRGTKNITSLIYC